MAAAAAAAAPGVVSRRLGATRGVGHLLLARPKALNALTLEMCRELNGVLGDWLGDGSLRCILLEGERGERGPVFCAGGDVKGIALEISSSSGSGRVNAASQGHSHHYHYGKPGRLESDFFREEYYHDFALGSLDRITPTSAVQVSVWDGVVMGGGVGLSIHGAYRIATENTLWAMPESAIGLFPDVGASYVLSRLPGGLGTYIGLLGARLSAADVMYAGLATHYVPSQSLPQLKNLLVASDGVGVSRILSTVSERDHGAPDSFLARHRHEIDQCFADKPSLVAILRALEGSRSEWAQQSLLSLRKLCPTSLALTFEQLSRARDQSLAECFVADFRLSQRAVARSDFVTGVHSVLINKAKSSSPPTWVPPAIEAIDEREIKAFFEPLGEYDWQPPEYVRNLLPDEEEE